MKMSSKFLVVLSLLGFVFVSQSAFAAEAEEATEAAPVTEEAAAPADCFYPDGQCSSSVAEEAAPAEEVEAAVEEASE